MSAEFEIVEAGVVANRYTEPLAMVDIQQMAMQDSKYADEIGKHVIVVADFSQIKNYPGGTLISLGIRHDDSNPIRNPKVEAVVVINTVPLMAQLASIVSKIARNEKLIVVHDWAEAMKEVGKLKGL